MANEKPVLGAENVDATVVPFSVAGVNVAVPLRATRRTDTEVYPGRVGTTVAVTALVGRLGMYGTVGACVVGEPPFWRHSTETVVPAAHDVAAFTVNPVAALPESVGATSTGFEPCASNAVGE
jgi:hypothetical protein